MDLSLELGKLITAHHALLEGRLPVVQILLVSGIPDAILLVHENLQLGRQLGCDSW